MERYLQGQTGVIPYNNMRKWMANNKRQETGQRNELFYVVCAKLDNYHYHCHQLSLLVCIYLHMGYGYKQYMERNSK